MTSNPGGQLEPSSQPEADGTVLVRLKWSLFRDRILHCTTTHDGNDHQPTNQPISSRSQRCALQLEKVQPRQS